MPSNNAPFVVGGHDVALHRARRRRSKHDHGNPFSLPLTSLCLDHQLSLWINRSFTTRWHDEDRMGWQRVIVEEDGVRVVLRISCDAPTGAPRQLSERATDEEKDLGMIQ
jgi:hypothetical protein